MKNILTQAEDIKSEITNWRRDLHQIPELGLDLPLTRSYICNVLDDLNIPYSLFDKHSGIVALIKGNNVGQKINTVGLRADMDALPIIEKTDLSYTSKNNNMHACGHDAHMAMLLGAAKLLSQQKNEILGNVKLIFEPSEELSGGAECMIKEKALENPNVDVIFGQHAGYMSPELFAGNFGFYSGPFMASRDTIYITVRGKTCHGALPAAGVDPIVISAQIITALQTLISREINGIDMVALTIGSIHGGETYNVIPDEVNMIGALRCLDIEIKNFLQTRIQEVCEGICKALRAECDITYEEGFPITVNDKSMTVFARSCAEELFGTDKVQTLNSPLMTSEDMSVS